jgi:hypothetical protein
VLESPEIRRLCLELSGQLSTLENLTDQAFVIAPPIYAGLAIFSEKATRGIEKEARERPKQ